MQRPGNNGPGGQQIGGFGANYQRMVDDRV